MKSTGFFVATKYQHSQIAHADPLNLIVMLYDGALARMSQARQRFLEGNILQAGLAVTKAQAILAELRKSLNMEEGEIIAANLDRLYSYIHQLLVKSMLQNQSQPLDEAAGLLTELRGAWLEVAKQAKEPEERHPESSTPAVGSTVSEAPSVKITV